MYPSSVQMYVTTISVIFGTGDEFMIIKQLLNQHTRRPKPFSAQAMYLQVAGRFHNEIEWLKGLAKAML
jgi:hypothetical protein